MSDKRKYADVVVRFVVWFEDDGDLCLTDQAHEAAKQLVPDHAEVEIIGEVRDEE